MTASPFQHVLIDSIIIEPERQRTLFDDIESLAVSIRDNGLINPITIDQDFRLIAGERRLRAHIALGYTHIMAQFLSDLSDLQRKTIELEENIRRAALTWQEECRAVAELVTMKQAADAKATVSTVAEDLNMSPRAISRYLLVNEYLDAGVPEVIDAPKFSTAVQFSERRKERDKHNEQKKLDRDIIASVEQPKAEACPDGLDPALVKPALAPDPIRGEIRHASFLEFVQGYSGLPFNLIHCDFPYGVKTGDKVGQSAAKLFGTYPDTPEVYAELIAALIDNQDSFIAESAHLIFWFPMTAYTSTKLALEAGGWRVYDSPLIWHKSDNKGMLPDPNREGRRNYETAFHCTRGDRKIVKPRSNIVAAPNKKDLHTSEKDLSMLEHFMGMFVDESSRVLDPTCGSGNAIKAALKFKPEWALGLEINGEFAEIAKRNLARA